MLRIDVLLPRMRRTISSIRDLPQFTLHDAFSVECVVKDLAPIPLHDERKIVHIDRILHTSTLSQVLLERSRPLPSQRFTYQVFHPPAGNTLHVSHDERPHRIPKDVQCVIQRVPIRSLPRRTHRLNTSNEYSAPAASFPRRQESSLHTTLPLHGLHTSHPQYTTHVFPHSAHPSFPRRRESSSSRPTCVHTHTPAQEETEPSPNLVWEAVGVRRGALCALPLLVVR